LTAAWTWNLVVTYAHGTHKSWTNKIIILI